MRLVSQLWNILSLRKVHKLQIFQNCLRKYLDQTEVKYVGNLGYYIMRNFMIYTVTCCYGNEMREVMMDWICKWNEEKKLIQNLVGKSTSKQALGRQRRIWNSNTKMDLRKISCGWSYQDCVQWSARHYTLTGLLLQK
jgi:hypothetical protein